MALVVSQWKAGKTLKKKEKKTKKKGRIRLGFRKENEGQLITGTIEKQTRTY